MKEEEGIHRRYRRYYRSASGFDNGAVESSINVWIDWNRIESTMEWSNRQVWKSVSDTDRRMEQLELLEVSTMVTSGISDGDIPIMVAMPEQDCRSVEDH